MTTYSNKITGHTDNQKSKVAYINITEQFVKSAKYTDVELTRFQSFEEMLGSRGIVILFYP